MRIRTWLPLLAVLMAVLTSCVTGRVQDPLDFDEAPLFGMAYDLDNQPVSGARIIVDGEPGPLTDINGRFFVRSLDRGTHRIGVSKDGCETLDLSFDFLNRSQVLYLKVTTYHQLLRELEGALEERKGRRAETLIRRAEAIDPDHPVGRYLKALHLLQTGRPEEAAAVLESILGLGFGEATIHLTLADVYQYRLRDNRRATAALEEYLAWQEDPEARRRLEELLQPAEPGGTPAPQE